MTQGKEFIARYQYQYRAIQWTGKNFNEICEFLKDFDVFLNPKGLVLTLSSREFMENINLSDYIMIRGRKIEIKRFRYFEENYESVSEQEFPMISFWKLIAKIKQAFSLRHYLSKM